MEKNLKEQARELVEKLNNEALERGGMEQYLPYTLKDQGWFCWIELMGQILWDSDNDMRDYINEHEQETLEMCIFRQTLSLMNDLNKKLGLDNDWVDTCDDDPVCYRTGNWDGKASDEVLVKTTNGELRVAICYQTESGITRDVYTYYDATSDFEIEVDCWQEIK